MRIRCFRRLLPDDFIAGFAWILLLATAITWQVIVPDLYEVMEVGAGLRMPSVNFIDHLLKYSRGQLAILFIFYVGLWTIKMNFLVFFYRLGNQITYYRIAWWCISIFTVCTFLACIGTVQYGCLAGDVRTLMVDCTAESAVESQNVTLKINCAWDVTTDALIMALPISILWNVRISTRRRLALIGVFALVVITMVISIVRVAVVTNAASHRSKQVESTWLYTWHFTESFVALIVACLASFRALFATKERSREEREAAEREQYEGKKTNHLAKGRALRARAKHFQDSLFETMKSTDGTTMKGTVTTVGMNDSERNMRADSYPSTLQEVSRTNSHGMRDLPELNSHGLIGNNHRV